MNEELRLLMDTMNSILDDGGKCISKIGTPYKELRVTFDINGHQYEINIWKTSLYGSHKFNITMGHNNTAQTLPSVVKKDGEENDDYDRLEILYNRYVEFEKKYRGVSILKRFVNEYEGGK